MQKLPDWENNLHALIHARLKEPFDWGGNDCMAWTADAVEAQTGVDTLADYRGKYNSPKTALQALRRIGAVKLPIDLADALWGDRIHISQAQLGDPVVAMAGFPEGMGPSMGVCYGRNSLFVGVEPGRSGLITIPTLSLEHCYKPWAS